MNVEQRVNNIESDDIFSLDTFTIFSSSLICCSLAATAELEGEGDAVGGVEERCLLIVDDLARGTGVVGG